MNDIIYNVKVCTWLKNQLLKNVSDIFSLSNKVDKKDEVSDAISSSILVCYLLSLRFGISIDEINDGMYDKVKLGILNEHICEKQFSDLSHISKYINKGRCT